MDKELREDSPGGPLLCPQGALSPFREAVVGHDDRTQVLALPLTHHATLASLFVLSGLQFYYLQNGDNNTSLTGLLRGLNGYESCLSTAMSWRNIYFFTRTKCV